MSEYGTCNGTDRFNQLKVTLSKLIDKVDTKEKKDEGKKLPEARKLCPDASTIYDGKDEIDEDEPKSVEKGE